MKETPLEKELIEWHWLRPHHERDALWVVATSLHLEMVGGALARDDAELVKSWLASGALHKPDTEQLERWNSNPTQPLSMLIVQPFVLVQEQILS